MKYRYILVGLFSLLSHAQFFATARHAAKNLSAGKLAGSAIGKYAGGDKGSEIGGAIVGVTATAIGAAQSDISDVEYSYKDLKKMNKSLMQENRLLRRDLHYWHAKAEATETINEMLREENEQLRSQTHKGFTHPVSINKSSKQPYITERKYTKKRHCPTCRKKRHPFHKPCLPEEEYAPMPLEADDTEAPDVVDQYVPEEYTSEIGISSDSLYK
ncbi:MAG TPA: hypothetical protein VFF04_07080 [Candidatus Babeliales bacterium]|nr:hypothetical protein [Candidatus Babeliales bacterium]